MWDRLQTIATAATSLRIPVEPTGSDDIDLPNADSKLSDKIFRALTDEYSVITASSMNDRCQSLMDHLLQRQPESRPFNLTVVETEEPFACIFPGRHIFIGTRILECEDDAVAFVLAHEIAHFQLGHTARVGQWFKRLGEFELATLALMVERLALSADCERAADARSLEIVHRAGAFNLRNCLAIFDLLEPAEAELNQIWDNAIGRAASRWNTSAEWLRERVIGYPRAAERRQLAEAQILYLSV